MHINLYRAVWVIAGALLASLWFTITGGTTPAAATLLLVALVVASVAVAIFRSAANEHDRVVRNLAEQALSPCQYRPIENIPCGRHAGHNGPHLVRPSDLARAGYAPPPF